MTLRNLITLSLTIAASTPLMAMQPLGDESMAAVSGQSGITIEVVTQDPDGDFMTTGAIRFTENDKDGKGQDYLEIGSLKFRTIETDGAGNMIGVDTIRTDIDIDSDGNVSIRSSDINTLDLELGEISLSGRTLFSAVRFSVWEFVGNSYLETVLLNDISGSKIAFRTVMEAGSGLTYQFDEDGLTFSSDVVFLPASGQSEFRSELFLTGDNDRLKLEFGETSGSFEIKNISLLNPAGENIFGTNNFGDIGYADITVNEGYLTIAANTTPGVDGIQGVINSDVNVGSAFYRTGNQRLNLRNVQLRTNGEINYQTDFTDNGFSTGLDTTISGVSDLDLIIGGLTLSSGDGSNESLSMGSYAIENLDLNGGSIEQQLYTLPGAGAQGMQMDLTIAGTTSFNLTIKDDPAVNSGDPDPVLSAEIVLNNVSVSQSIDQTSKGLHIGVLDQSMDMNINAIRIGDGQLHQGQTGRLVMNNLTLQPGSYFRIEPLQ